MKTNRRYSLLFCLILFSFALSSYGQSKSGLATGGPVPAPGQSQIERDLRAQAASDGVSFDSTLYSASALAADVCEASGPVPIRFDSLQYAGVKVAGRPLSCARIPGVTSINAAIQRICGVHPIVNPGNPIYTVDNAGMPTHGKGTENTNPDGYFYCMSNEANHNMRYNICKVTAPEQYSGQFVFNWNPNSTGASKCGFAPIGSTDWDYSGATPGAITVTGSRCPRGTSSYNPTPYPANLEDALYCKCASPHEDRFFKVDEAATQCANVLAETRIEQDNVITARPPKSQVDSNTAAPAAAPAVAPSAEAEFRACLQSWQTLAQTCKQHADEANASCQSKRRQDSTIDGANGALSALGQGVNVANAGQGTQGTCFNAGVAALSARTALDSTRQSCNTDFAVCTRECAEDSFDRFMADCPAKIGKTSAMLETESGPLAEAYTTAAPQIKYNFTNGHSTCQNDTQTNRNGLSQIVSDLGRTVQASTICACQTSSTTGQNCTQIPTIETCEQTNNANCGAYSAISGCVAGSPGYDAKACACVSNPSAPGCTPALVAKITSNFATNAVPAASVTGAAVSGFTGGGGSGGGSGTGNFGDLSGNGGDTTAAVLAGNLKQGSAPPSSTGGATGGAVSAGGGSGGGAPTEPVAPVAEKATGIKGMFNDLKTTVSRALFGPSGSGGTNAKNTNPVDVSRFKPNAKLRGGPIERDVASANEKTIFELVNECANGLRCKSVTTRELLTGP